MEDVVVIRLLVRLSHLFEKEDTLNFVLLGVAILLNSLLEILGIGLLIPFVALLGKPELVQTNHVVSAVYDFFHFQSFAQFMIVVAASVAVVFILKSLLLLGISFWQAKFIFEKKVFLKTRLFHTYLTNPYPFHLKSDLARLQRNLELVESAMNNVVLQLFYIVTELVLVACLFLMLLWANAVLTVATTVFLGGLFFIYYFFTKDRFRRMGEIANEHRVRALQQVNQGLGSIKEVKIFGKERFFAERFQHHSWRYAWQETKGELLTRTPRLLIEALIVGFVMLGVIVYFLIGNSTDKIFITLSLVAIVAVRLMPSLNRITSGWGSIKLYSVYFDQVYDDLVASSRSEDTEQAPRNHEPLLFRETIKLEDLSFVYEDCSKPALDRVSLLIPKNATVGFVGPSGAGKTTAIDIIIGLLKPSQGRVLIDGVDIYDNLRGWQDQIGYIPQAIYLCNDSIRQNVAFGNEPRDIDEAKVRQALRLAQLEEFVMGLPEGLDTEIGERGVRLSGGQRQRIGIARALYNDPSVLVMDEATAALDNETERAFMESLTNLSGSKTILIIAHRLTTVQACDVIFFLKDGRLVATGKYEELLNKCPGFRDMAGAGISASGANNG
jgi:ATP-binding cassette subfamily C protein